MTQEREGTSLTVLALGREGIESTDVARLSVELTTSPGELLERLREKSRDATLLAIAPEELGEELVRRIREHPNTGVLILYAPAVTLERALLAQRVGIREILTGPLDALELRARIEAEADEGLSVPLPVQPGAGSRRAGVPPPLVGESPVMAPVFNAIAQISKSEVSVLVTGESGTGKEVIARTVHWASDRSSGPFVAVNCAAIPEHLLESELFGHERGSFTGAVAPRLGRFQRADGGTLFLDEIGDMSLVLQAKLLRALEEKTVERVGAEASESVDVRVVAATNQDLTRAIREGRFREDLYWRLAVVDLHLPPLRERHGDVRRLALHFAAHFASAAHEPVRAITERALQRLEADSWKGNVRELRNVVQRAALLARGGVIRSKDLRLGAAAPTLAGQEVSEPTGYPAELSLEEVEAHHIRRALGAFGGGIARAAESLGIHRNTLTRKLREYGITAQDPAEEAS